ncbi:MAG TPA: MFS transporter [Blastocatellia bacterium]|nr:MFS transporter [Blastocatellia bacterium]
MRKHTTGLLLVGLTYLGFVSLGLPDGLLGVAWPSIRAYFNLPLDALGALLVMFTTGYLASSFFSGRLLARMNVGSLLALSCLATAVSLLGYALTPWWSAMVALGLISGLGAGAIDAGLNTYAATHFSARSVNWLHACYGVGAAIGPVIMTYVLMADRPWQLGYGIVGAWQLALAACFGLTRAWWPDTNAMQNAETPSPLAPASSFSTLRLPVAWLSVAVSFVYTGIEAAAGAWAYSLFTEARAIPPGAAGMWISVYWGGLTAGRLLSGFIVGFLSVRLLLRLCALGIILGAALMWLNITDLLSFLGLGLMGLSSAPVFPSLIATTPGRLGEAHTSNGVGFQIAAAVLGQSLLPTLVGVLADKLGLEVVGPALLTAAILLFGLYEMLEAISPKVVREAPEIV